MPITVVFSLGVWLNLMNMVALRCSNAVALIHARVAIVANARNVARDHLLRARREQQRAQPTISGDGTYRCLGLFGSWKTGAVSA